MKFRFSPRISAGLLGLLFLPLCATAGQPAGPPQQSQPGSDARPAMSAKDLEIEKARIMMAEKKYDGAIQIYQEVLKQDPKNALVLNMTGIAYLNLSRYDQAKKYFERSAKADKHYSSAVNNLGMVYYHQKNFRRAIREYQRAVAIDPTLAGTHANLGFAYYNTNKLPEAAAEFQKALELQPDIFEQNNRVGTMVQDRSVANHGLFFFTMARVYGEKNDAPHCAEYLRKSLDEGYKDVGKARSDPAFKKVLNDPDVQAVLLRIAPVEGKAAASHPGA
ncbi:MAG: tetratricopeptide repeat protein [Acidobacteriia bacterium]|nr:tetratricopeptide repeat protein [Terriglobia bacterium]